MADTLVNFKAISTLAREGLGGEELARSKTLDAGDDLEAAYETLIWPGEGEPATSGRAFAASRAAQAVANAAARLAGEYHTLAEFLARREDR